MNKYILKPGNQGLIQFNTETEDINISDHVYSCIDWIYLAPEDGVLTVVDTDIKDMPIKKNQLIIVFYPHNGIKHRAVTIDSEYASEWLENIIGIREAEEKRAREISEKCADNSCSNCCASEIPG